MGSSHKSSPRQKGHIQSFDAAEPRLFQGARLQQVLLLYTTKILIAYEFYHKLGYKDAVGYSSAYKVVKNVRKAAGKTRKKKLDWDRLLALFNDVTKNSTGFVIRNRQYGRMLEIRKKIHPEKSIVTDRGYALLREDAGNVYVEELIALEKEEGNRLIAQIEGKATKAIIDEKVVSSETLDTYKSRGFMIIGEGYDLLLSKRLTDKTFAETYGQQFHATSADSF